MVGPGFWAGRSLESRALVLVARRKGVGGFREMRPAVRPARGYVYGQCAGAGEMSCEFDESGHGICVGEGWAPVILPDGGFGEAWCGV